MRDHWFCQKQAMWIFTNIMACHAQRFTNPLLTLCSLLGFNFIDGCFFPEDYEKYGLAWIRIALKGMTDWTWIWHAAFRSFKDTWSTCIYIYIYMFPSIHMKNRNAVFSQLQLRQRRIQHWLVWGFSTQVRVLHVYTCLHIHIDRMGVLWLGSRCSPACFLELGRR